MRATSPSHGRGAAVYSDRVREGDLTKEQRKAMNKVVGDRVKKGAFEHSHVCIAEMGSMLECFEKHEQETEPCGAYIASYQACVKANVGSPDPAKLAYRWQIAARRAVMVGFVRGRR